MIASSSIFVEQSSCAPRLRKSAGLRVHRTSLVATRGKEVSFPSNLSTSFHKLELIGERGHCDRVHNSRIRKSLLLCDGDRLDASRNDLAFQMLYAQLFEMVNQSYFTPSNLPILAIQKKIIIIIHEIDVILNDILIDHPLYHYFKR